MTRGKANKLRELIEALTTTLDDETALSGIELFPNWKESSFYKLNDRVQYNGALYKCIQEHMSQSDWAPDIAVSLFVKVYNDEWPLWVKPTGAHDAYMVGDKVSYNSEHYVCTMDNNVYAPDILGWKKH